ncbi:DUF2214 domain-containing protein [Falsiroseomonas bella]|uniref:DUF2214 domain-containing protein n=1 Tax=Falsiroseomonas bella TaxID=2184016 RepID=UPI0018EEA250|nr:DUF2214 domain-containing protein [Falsiroseomonas bella]
MWEALAAWPVAEALRRSAILYPLVNAAHILGIGLLLGTIAALDLRLLGAFRAVPLALVGPMLARLAAAGLGVAAVTGLLLFSTRPAAYAENPAFLAKLALVGLGLGNVALLRAGRGWRAALAGAAPSPGVRAAAALSLAAWVGAVVAGRWIGFLQ